MKKLLFLIAFLTASLAYADPFPAAPADGEKHWQNGLRYIYQLLNNSWYNANSPSSGWMTETETNTFLVDKEGKEIMFLCSGTYAINLDSAATLGNNFSFGIKNIGGGTLTVTPSGIETIEGAPLYVMSTVNESIEFISDGSNWHIATTYDAGAGSFWQRIGTILSPATAGDDVETTGGLILSGAPGSLTRGIRFGDLDSGLTEQGDDNLQFYFSSSPRIALEYGRFGSVVSGAAEINTYLSDSVTPAYRFRGDTDTGVGRANSDELSLTAGGVEGIRVNDAEAHSVAGIANYETLVVADDDIPNKKYVDDEIANSTYWQRVGTVLSPKTAADDVDYGTGNLTSSATVIARAHDTTIPETLILGDGGGSLAPTGYPEGDFNTFVGHKVCDNTTVGRSMTAVGYNAAANWLSGGLSVCMGYNACDIAQNGSGMTAIGALSESGAGGTAVGFAAGSSILTTGVTLDDGLNNTLIGYQSGRYITDGDNNTMLGYNTGQNIVNGLKNVIIGYDTNPTGDVSFQLFIDNGPGDTPLIWGDFSTDDITLNADLTVRDTSILQGNTTIGAGVAGVDYTLTFDGETNDGVIQYMEDEAQFKFNDGIHLDSGTGTLSTGISFNGNNDGFYVDGSNNMQHVFSGTERFELAINAFRAKTTYGAQLNNGAGGSGVPVFTFVGDTNTGLTRLGLDKMGFVAGGTDIGFVHDDNTDTGRKYAEFNEIQTARVLFEDEFWGVIGPQWATRVTTGSRSPISNDNGWMRLTTGTTATNEESIDWNDIVQFTNTKQPEFRVRVNLASVTDIEFEFGLIEASGAGDNDYIRIHFDDSTMTNWELEACTAGVCTSDLGGNAVTGVHEFLVVFDSDTTLQWFVDGITQGTVLTNVPTVALQPYEEVRTETTAAKTIDTDFFRIWQDRN